MQQHNAEFPAKLSRSPENVAATTTVNPQQFPRLSNNPRLAITPEAMGMNLRSDTPTCSRMQQSQQPTTPVVDVKSYCERPRRSTVELYKDVKQESNDSFQSANTNLPNSSYDTSRKVATEYCLLLNTHNKAELITQSPSPSTSPQMQHQPQWNFAALGGNSEYLLQDAKVPVTSTPKSTGELIRKNGQFSGTLYRPTFGQLADIQDSISMPVTPTEEHNSQKFRSGSDVFANDTAKLNFKVISDMYAKRIEDANACGDKDFIIFTYQEWVEVLTKINEFFLKDMEELEREVAGRLELMQKRVNSNCRHSQGNEIMKCRKDIETLLKYIKTNNKYNWDLRSLTLETLTPDQILYMCDFESLAIEDSAGGEDIKNYSDADIINRNKLYANMKALAQEVAEKHDEVRELKRQVICLEDEIQKAQKKIQLKDDVIKELRNDLKCANNKIANYSPLDAALSMPPINVEHQSYRSANTQITDNTSTFQAENVSQFDALSYSDLEEQQLKILKHEIEDLLETTNNVVNKHKIMEVIEKKIKFFKESEKAANCKLANIRRQLIDLESEFSEEKSDCDSGFHSKMETDHYAKLLGTIRQRLRRHYETICDLRKKIHKLDLDNSELRTSYETEKSISRRSSDILKQVADLLASLKGKQLSYKDAYTTDPNQLNPFCEYILEMQNDFKEKEAQLRQNLDTRDRKIEELSQVLLERGQHYFQGQALFSIPTDIENIDKTPPVLLSSSTLTPSPQSTTTHVTAIVTKPSTTSSTTAQQSDNKTATLLQRLLDK